MKALKKQIKPTKISTKVTNTHNNKKRKILFGLDTTQSWLLAVHPSNFQSNRGLFYPLNYPIEAGQPFPLLIPSYTAQYVGRDPHITFPNPTSLLRGPSSYESTKGAAGARGTHITSVNADVQQEMVKKNPKNNIFPQCRKLTANKSTHLISLNCSNETLFHWCVLKLSHAHADIVLNTSPDTKVWGRGGKWGRKPAFLGLQGSIWVTATYCSTQSSQYKVPQLLRALTLHISDWPLHNSHLLPSVLP